MRMNGNKHFEYMRDLGFVVFVLLFVIFIQMRNKNFLSLENMQDLAANTAILSILSVGMMMVIITRGIDLSIGATLAFVGMSVSLLVSAHPGMPAFLALVLGALFGLLCGGAVGLIISKGKVLPIIATLGMMNIFRGLTFIISGGRWVSAHQMPQSFKAIATGSQFGINNIVLLALLVNVFFYYMLNATRLGRKIYAVGSNPESACVSGINGDAIMTLVYSIMGLLAGLSGVLWVSKFASAQGDTANGYELSVIAACVLGGVSISGGVGSVPKLLLGVLLLGILNNALPLVNVPPFWQYFIQGCIILCAVLSNALVKRGIDYAPLKQRCL